MAKLARALILSLLLLSITASVNGYDRLVGGRSEVKDVKKNKEVQELGKFSVEEFNRSQQRQGKVIRNVAFGRLRFSQVLEAQKQVVSGIKYYLTIEATTGENGEIQMFDSIV
ncbi:hypothetical protein CISIN_1g035532mg, partial [Citrus sinensis]